MRGGGIPSTAGDRKCQDRISWYGVQDCIIQMSGPSRTFLRIAILVIKGCFHCMCSVRKAPSTTSANSHTLSTDNPGMLGGSERVQGHRHAINHHIISSPTLIHCNVSYLNTIISTRRSLTKSFSPRYDLIRHDLQNENHLVRANIVLGAVSTCVSDEVEPTLKLNRHLLDAGFQAPGSSPEYSAIQKPSFTFRTPLSSGSFDQLT